MGQCWPPERAAIGFCKKFLFISTIGSSLCSFESPWHLALRFLYYEPCGCLARHAGSYSLSFLRKGTAFISRSAGWPAYSVCMFRTGLRYSQLSTGRKCKVRERFVERHLGTRNHHVLDGKTGRIAAGERETEAMAFQLTTKGTFAGQGTGHCFLVVTAACPVPLISRRNVHLRDRLAWGTVDRQRRLLKERNSDDLVAFQGKRGRGKGKINGWSKRGTMRRKILWRLSFSRVEGFETETIATLLHR
ncbi:hypothetical protein CMEL01_04268 [Colletotrichum melonis]|uniref:Uncharacterized protein n=1 Tax=Colletotrichum melonis TaxID=1209925 RepID=A0AAI9UEI1_9PEZI|nr:hypothetical protein CMEL01_04268 [Colletotrichum melonis]